MRKSCKECIQKHIMTAAVYLTRAAVLHSEKQLQNYFVTKALGELGEAIDEGSQSMVMDTLTHAYNVIKNYDDINGDFVDLQEIAQQLDAQDLVDLLPEEEGGDDVRFGQ